MAMSLLVQDIIRDAMGLIGAIAKDESPSPDEYKLAMRVSNMMLDKWSIERLMLRSTINENFVLTGNVGTYTIGPSANFNTTKPIRIVGAFVRDGANVDIPITIVTRSQFDSYNDKAFASARPVSLFYDPGNAQGSTTGTIYLYYMPDTASTYKLFIDSDKYLTEFGAITDVVTFEPAYYEALVYNLAERLFRYYNKPDKKIPEDVIGLARSSKSALKALNSQPVIASMEIPGKVSVFNIYNDTVM